MEECKIGLYRHYKGKQYRVIGCAKHSEDLEEYVVYQALYGECHLWIRPKAMFFENVNKDGKVFLRFEYIGPEV